jgi:hypothetical protein
MRAPSEQVLDTDKTLDAKLPDELLSLLLDAPAHDAYQDDELARFPIAVRSYLLSWHLVFDAFRTAAFKVRNDYAEQLKASASLEPLMDFMFDVLGHSAARPLGLDRAGITSEHIHAYDVKTADGEPDERNMHWLLIHLFYLSMKYLPGLFKTWFLNCRSKQTKVAVEAWMTKYFSPLIIAENLDEVADWAAKQEPPEEDEKELVVKVSRAAKEITAGYEVDELQASIAIRIPPSYPLESVTVLGINRVAVSEKKWQSWLMITQGVITLGVRCYDLLGQLCASIANIYDNFIERQHHRRADDLPAQRRGRAQGPDRVRHLLLDHLDGQEDAGQEVRHLQERVPPHLSVQVVPDQPPEHVSAMPEPDRLLGVAIEHYF